MHLNACASFCDDVYACDDGHPSRCKNLKCFRCCMNAVAVVDANVDVGVDNLLLPLLQDHPNLLQLVVDNMVVVLVDQVEDTAISLVVVRGTPAEVLVLFLEDNMVVDT